MPDAPKRGTKPAWFDVRYDAVVLEPITFESGVKLRKGDIVHVDSECDDVLGVKWTDKEGTHVAAILADCVFKGRVEHGF